jgi:hypothetical protein
MRGFYNVNFKIPGFSFPPAESYPPFVITEALLYDIERYNKTLPLNRARTSYLHFDSQSTYWNYGYNTFGGYTASGTVSGVDTLNQTRLTLEPTAITLKSKGSDHFKVTDHVRVLTNLVIDNSTLTKTLTTQFDTTTNSLSVTTFTRTNTLSVHDGTSTRFLNVSAHTNTDTLSAKNLTTTNFLSTLSGTYTNFLNVLRHTNTETLSVENLTTTETLSVLSGSYTNFLNVLNHTNTRSLSVKDHTETYSARARTVDIVNSLTVGSGSLGTPLNYIYHDSSGYIEVDNKVYYSAEVLDHMIEWMGQLGDKIYNWYEYGNSSDRFNRRHTMSYPASANDAYQAQKVWVDGGYEGI